MGQVLGELLPLAVAVAVSPVPIIATVLLLLSPRASSTSAGFLLGWVVGVAATVTLFTVIADTAGLSEASGPSRTASWIKIVLGVLVLLLAVRQWHGRPRSKQDASLPQWMSAIDSITTGRAVLLGVALSALNPKNLLMCLAAAATIGGVHLEAAQQVVAVVVFVVIAVSTVVLPVLAYAAAGERMRPWLDELKTWLEANNVAVMSVLLLVIGIALVGKGIGGL